MQDWLSYRLTDFIMYSQSSYGRLLERYNDEFWPWQILILLVALYCWHRAVVRNNVRALLLFLSFAYAFCAYFFFWDRYSNILPIAPFFAALFVVQGMLCAWVFTRGSSRVVPKGPTKIYLAHGLIVYALLAHPLLPPLTGKTVSLAETVAFMPNPTIALNIGAFLLLKNPRWWLFLAPLLWLSFSVLTELGLYWRLS